MAIRAELIYNYYYYYNFYSNDFLSLWRIWWTSVFFFCYTVWSQLGLFSTEMCWADHVLLKPAWILSTNWNSLEEREREREREKGLVIILQTWMGGKRRGLSCVVSDTSLVPGLGCRAWTDTWCFVRWWASCWLQTRLRQKPATKTACLGNAWTDRVCVIEDGLGISVSTATAGSSEYTCLHAA